MSQTETPDGANNLVARLIASAKYNSVSGRSVYAKTFREAADRIKALEAENAELRKDYKQECSDHKRTVEMMREIIFSRDKVIAALNMEGE